MKDKIITIDRKTQPNGAEFYAVRVYVKGIRKRCRKTEFMGFDVAAVSLSTKDDPQAIEELKKLASELLQTNMKSIDSCQLSFCHEKINGEFLLSSPFHELNFQAPIDKTAWAL